MRTVGRRHVFSFSGKGTTSQSVEVPQAKRIEERGLDAVDRIECAAMIERPVGALILVLLLAAFGGPAAASAADRPFEAWRAELRREAVDRGIAATTFDRAFTGVVPIAKIVQLDRRQPEFLISFWRYLDSRVTAERIERGRRALDQYRSLLAAIEARYGVQPEIIVAFWGLETNYGGDVGGFRAVDALATLAYDGRREAFFRDQLLMLLHLIDAGDVPLDAPSSWAGALGQTQFMPTTYRDHAVDFDGDGRRDLWGSEADAFASAAAFLAGSGWQANAAWGREVLLPEDFDYGLTGLHVVRPIELWDAAGVVTAEGAPLPSMPDAGSILLPAGVGGGPALIVHTNFHEITNWNRSIFYAVSVGHLADRIAGGGPFRGPRRDDETLLARSDVEEIQERLTLLGYDTGGVDGMVGARTREAIGRFQNQQNLPADGYPTPELLSRLRQATGG